MGKELTDEQVASMREAFSLFDTDGDGRIAPSELGILMRSLGGNPTQAQLKEIVSAESLVAPFDFPRFLELMRKHMRPEPFDRQLRDAFKVLDKDSTGLVAVADLRHVLTSIGETRAAGVRRVDPRGGRLSRRDHPLRGLHHEDGCQVGETLEHMEQCEECIKFLPFGALCGFA
ncbi:putative calcium-binding protein CML7 [Iris pallida]|uniref:Calcium-binding protein CML7 n=1 Tax=Iris pallida TaxID=29817 RepID=A0AAX6GMR8_IRIPA|nr:putative calcium-binding protein CML7 [Iris pallida]